MPWPASKPNLKLLLRRAALRPWLCGLVFALSCCLGRPVMFGQGALPQNSPRAQATAVDSLYPFRIALIASRGGADTSALTSADLLSPHLGQRPVVLFFWMTTCGPCRGELADLEQRLPAWQAQYDFALVPVSLDFAPRRDAFHARAADYPWTSYFDVARAFPSVMPGGLNGVPQIFVYDASGQLIFHRRKYHPGDLEALEEVLKG